MKAISWGLLLWLITGTACAEVVVVVSAENPVESLTSVELADIYLGRMHTFPNGESVVPVDQRENSLVHHEFYSLYLGRTPAQIKAHWSKLIFSGRGQPPRIVAGDKAVAEFVSGNHQAIGYVTPDLVDKRLRVVPIE
ncbi:phosphate ABC transporter substrate-binding protein [Sulfuriflexus sp.]|uniref:phosphate ABC transporter substrate-binding protein n=1 Tax=Sulfuriflexus sp. TaxID=2015443 RepID=UPI0028CF2D6D|nr:phosphate ABC transporter substrate-binding protein [Sulfuriflexus sp.]MDT8403011.1 phosphate ABC transporter substrate-binding protein [Sulfuriflexus sp.]